MKTLIFFTILLAVNSLVPNCAYESNNVCRSCYYGFNLDLGRCDNCSVGFIMVKNICIDQASYEQQISMQSQRSILNTVTGTNVQQQYQTQTQVTPAPLSTINTAPQNTQQYQTQTLIVSPSVIYPQQTVQQYQTQTITVAPPVSYPTQSTQITSQYQTAQKTNIVSGGVSIQTPTTSTISNSNGMIFDVNNTAINYLLQMKGLTSQIPLNCKLFTVNFKCVQCLAGYRMSSGETCVIQNITTNSTGTGISTQTSTQSSISSITQSVTSASQSSSNSQQISGASAITTEAVTNNDPNCQNVSADGRCSQCFYRYYYSTVTKNCVQVNNLCASWDNVGNCLTCYGGYKLNNVTCIIDQSSSATGSSSQNQALTSSSTETRLISISQGSTSSLASTTESISQSSIKTPGSVFTRQSATASSGNTASVVSSDPNCKTSGANGCCHECYYSYYYNSQRELCVPVNSLCQTWNYLGSCLSCFPGYVLSGTQCVVNETVNAGVSSTGTVNSGSSTSSSSLSSSNSLPTSSSFSSSSSSSSSSGAQTSGSITSTITGQIFATNFDSNCKMQNIDGSCLVCYNSFYYDAINTKRCVSVNPLCKSWNSSGSCLSCYQGYTLTSSLTSTTCVIQSIYLPSSLVGPNDLPTNQDPYCNTYQNQICIKCAFRTYLDPKTKRCLAIDTNCMNWTNSGTCTACYNGYYIYNQTQCLLIYPQVVSSQLKSSSNIDSSCRASDSNGICTQCITRFVLDPIRKICIKVNDQCKTWCETTALCTSCYGGYTLTSSGQCIVSF